MAYRLFYSRTHPVGPAIYATYDIQLTAAANRMPETAYNTNDEAGVGRTLTPAANYNAHTYDLSLYTDSTKHRPRSNIVWVDNYRFAFMDFDGTDAAMNLWTSA